MTPSFCDHTKLMKKMYLIKNFPIALKCDVSCAKIYSKINSCNEYILEVIYYLYLYIPTGHVMSFDDDLAITSISR